MDKTGNVTKMPKVLIISYFFPPLSGPGVQRSYNFVRNLPDNGWEPVVLTVKDISYVARDENLLTKLTGTEIIRTETVDPMRILYLWDKLWGNKQEDSIYVQASESVRSFGRDIFPIDSKIGWLLTAFREACKLCRLNKIEVILATMSPYTSGILAYMVSKKMSLPYILDYRDLWQGKPDIKYFSRFHQHLAEKWEARIIRAAKAIIHVTEWSKERFLEIYPECERDKVSVIYNGYDREIIPAEIPAIMTEGTIRFTYAGHFYGGQKPDIFIDSIRELIAEGNLPEGVVFEFIGNFPKSIEELFFEHECIKRIQYLNYGDYIKKIIDSTVLLLFISSENSRMILTQKLFEYLAVRRPILAMIPVDGEAAAIINKYQAGLVKDGTSKADIKAGILEICGMIRKGEMTERLNVANNDYSGFERQAQAKQLAEIMDNVTDG